MLVSSMNARRIIGLGLALALPCLFAAIHHRAPAADAPAPQPPPAGDQQSVRLRGNVGTKPAQLAGQDRHAVVLLHPQLGRVANHGLPRGQTGGHRQHRQLIDGAGNDGSLNNPTGIPNRVEPVSRVQQTVVPQVGQKWWLIRVPASLVRVYILLGPSRRTVSLGKYAALLHGTPDRSWQS